jgi:ribonuclease Z
MSEEAALAERAAHSTARGAAETAAGAKVTQLVLTHFSARYESAGGSRMKELLDEAKSVFPNTMLAEDLAVIPVPRPSQ